MSEEFYRIIIDKNTVVADHMPLQFALILIKAIYGEFYNEPNLSVTIEKICDSEKAEVVE